MKACLLLQVEDVRLVSCLPIDEQGQAVLKELQALAGGLKAIADGSEDAEDVKTPRIAASPPPAAQPAVQAITQQQRQDAAGGKPSEAEAGQPQRQSRDQEEDEEIDRDEL